MSVFIIFQLLYSPRLILTIEILSQYKQYNFISLNKQNVQNIILHNVKF